MNARTHTLRATEGPEAHVCVLLLEVSQRPNTKYHTPNTKIQTATLTGCQAKRLNDMAKREQIKIVAFPTGCCAFFAEEQRP